MFSCRASAIFLLASLALAARSALAGAISADLSGGYSWGDYSSAGQAQDSYSGMATQLHAGYRFGPNLEAGLVGNFAFPQLAAVGSTSSASFSYKAFGLQLGYLWGSRFAPYIEIYPYAQLSQSTKGRVGVAMLTTDLSYIGQAYGAGIRIYLTDRSSRSAQVGIKASYVHQTFSRAEINSSLDVPDGRLSPPLASAGEAQPQGQNVTGNAYQLAVFIGI